MIAAVAEHGYRDTSVTLIAAAAGVSRRTFYGYFATKEACFFDTYDLFEDHLLKALREADVGERSWSAKVRARVQTLLRFLAANPNLVRFGILAPLTAGGDVGKRSREFLGHLVDRLTDGGPVGSGPDETAIELEAMAGAISSILVARIDSRDEHLEAAAPQLVELVLTPFLGHQRAAAEARKI